MSIYKLNDDVALRNLIWGINLADIGIGFKPLTDLNLRVVYRPRGQYHDETLHLQVRGYTLNVDRFTAIVCVLADGEEIRMARKEINIERVYPRHDVIPIRNMTIENGHGETVISGFDLFLLRRKDISDIPVSRAGMCITD